MTLLFRYSLSLLLFVLIHGKRKEQHTLKQKRDISDLKDDPILTSIFKSDLQEKRSDRSISLKDEKEEDKGDQLKQQELLKNLLFSAKDLYRRDTDNSQFNGELNNTLPIPDPYYASFSNPIIGNQIPLPRSSKLSYTQGNMVESAAVLPKLFASNYMPLENALLLPDSNYEVTKRDSIAQLPSEDGQPVVRSDIPSQSIPLQLRKHTPNAQLRGIVPHTTEYGETVESIERAQKVLDFKKSMLPNMPPMSPMLLNFPPVSQSMYSSEVIKKDVIPQAFPITNDGQVPIGGQAAKADYIPNMSAPVAVDLASRVPSPVAVDLAPRISAPVAVDLAPRISAPVAVDLAPRISAPVAVDLAPRMQSPVIVDLARPASKSGVAPTQVQNLDGAFTRPIISDSKTPTGVGVTDDNTPRESVITGEDCADQYATCGDFAKNSYCTRYYDLMKIQCRRSCGFCVPGENPVADNKKEEISKEKTAEPTTQPIETSSKPAEPSTEQSKLSNNSTVPQVETNKKVTETSKNDTKATKRSSATKVNKITETPKKNTETSKRKTDNNNKTAVTSKKSTDKSKKSLESSKKATTSKKSKDPSKKHSPESTAKSKSEGKSSASKKNKEEKHKDEKKDGDQKSKIAETESGSTNEGDSVDSGSGDLGSGDLGSGSGSGSGEEEPIVVVKSAVTKIKEKKEEKPVITVKASNKKNKIPSAVKSGQPLKATKSNLGEFTLPVTKSEVSTASLTLNEKNESEESGSGSASGEDPEIDITAKKSVIRKPAANIKANATKKIPAHRKGVVAPKRVKKPLVGKRKKIDTSAKLGKKSDKPSKRTNKTLKAVKGKHAVGVSKKSSVPEKPKKPSSYPKIDLKLIASALANYEEAALELAGEYPRPPSLGPSNEVARSEIPKPNTAAHVVALPRSHITHLHSTTPLDPPHSFETKKELIIDPLDKYKQNLEIAKLLTDDRNGRSSIPKYLKLTKDVKKGEDEEGATEYAADSLSSIQKRFNILGIEPTLIDYYAETGKINPFAGKQKKKGKNIRKSSIANNDPYEYLRNMPAGASMLPIDDPKARSKIPSDHSYPVFLMKVSPGEKKYVDEPPMRRGEIRHLNAEGVRIDEKTEIGGLPKDIVSKLQGKKMAPKENESPLKRTQPQRVKAPVAPKAAAVPSSPNAMATGGYSMLPNPFYPNGEQAMAMMSVAANLQNNLLQAQNGIPQAKTMVPKTPAITNPAALQKRRPAVVKGAVPHSAPRPANPQLSLAVAKAMEKSAFSSGLQYAQKQMKLDELNKLNARSKGPGNPNKHIATPKIPITANARSQAFHINQMNAAHKQASAIAAAQQRSLVKSAYDIAKSDALFGAPPVNELNSLKNKMVSAFFPMKKDGITAEGSGEVGKG